jgi:hypothetical protein
MHKSIIYFRSWVVTELMEKSVHMAQTLSTVVLNNKNINISV